METAVAIARAASSALGLLPDDQQMLYFILIESALGDAARKAFEMLPKQKKSSKNHQPSVSSVPSTRAAPPRKPPT